MRGTIHPAGSPSAEFDPQTWGWNTTPASNDNTNKRQEPPELQLSHRPPNKLITRGLLTRTSKRAYVEKIYRNRAHKEVTQDEAELMKEDIANFEHSLGLRMKTREDYERPSYLIQKQEDAEERQLMGLKDPPVPRPPSAWDYYDYRTESNAPFKDVIASRTAGHAVLTGKASPGHPTGQYHSNSRLGTARSRKRPETRSKEPQTVTKDPYHYIEPFMISERPTTVSSTATRPKQQTTLDTIATPRRSTTAGQSSFFSPAGSVFPSPTRNLFGTSVSRFKQGLGLSPRKRGYVSTVPKTPRDPPIPVTVLTRRDEILTFKESQNPTFEETDMKREINRQLKAMDELYMSQRE